MRIATRDNVQEIMFQSTQGISYQSAWGRVRGNAPSEETINPMEMNSPWGVLSAEVVFKNFDLITLNKKKKKKIIA